MCTKIPSGSVAWYWSVQQTARYVRSVQYTSQQFATTQFMERHENVTQGVTDKQEREASLSSIDEYLREVSRLSEHAELKRVDPQQVKRADPQRVRGADPQQVNSYFIVRDVSGQGSR